MLTVGVLINPVAGMGGAVGLKGSDGEEIQAEAIKRGGRGRGGERAAALFEQLGPVAEVRWLAAGGDMGSDAMADAGIDHEVLPGANGQSSPDDTRRVAQLMESQGADVLLFFGGDGTARDLYDALGDRLAVLGVPSGVKMHSGVFATSPRAAAEVLKRIIQGGLVAAMRAEVRDVDEAAIRSGRTGSQFYGEMRVPELGGFIQATKVGGREDEALALVELVQGAIEALAAFAGPLVLGPGGTVQALKQALGTEGTLLGFDVRMPDGTWALDVTGEALEALAGPKVIIGFARSQGVLIGRGNQQLTPAFLRGLDRAKDVMVLATRGKVASLDGQPLLLDTSDAQLDLAWSGLWELLVGYEDYLFYQVTRA